MSIGELGRLRIHSPKTEHLDGRSERSIPLFPELQPYLESAWNEAEPGTEWVITRYRSTNANLRTQLQRIIRRAGLKPFQNLRSTRETELAMDFPVHVVCAWIGNSAAVVAKHYLQVTDADFERAQQGAAATRNIPQQAGDENKKSPVLPSFSEGCEFLLDGLVPPDGLEPSTL